ncbi:hsp20/alpha crystallin family protein [Medicago truncatula]|uniref:Hsp20/alpha crystallin family protein n=1 Tax=Medicago truncatula TaxID=3880 RepID=G7L4X7_MEDTR|nr:hsp20/alpha crystallin family protein [Medicago truncatula]
MSLTWWINQLTIRSSLLHVESEQVEFDAAGMRETKDSLLLRLDTPGLGKEDVKISVEQNTLTIKGEGAKESEEVEEGGRKFSSRIDLPEKLYKIDQIKAEMKNGVLKVIVPKMKKEEMNNVVNVKVE